MLPKLRKSLQKNEKRVSPPALLQKDPYAIEAPKAVIRALYDYVKNSTQELSFSKGDFFHVVSDEKNSEWYNVCNPATGAQGLVPAQYFQVLGRNSKESVHGRASVSGTTPETMPVTRSRSTTNTQPTKTSPLYGIVQYDFQAERPDELDAKAGEAIIIIAQSNHEWFVAKPIGRLGGPGLIPVSFIEIRDMSTGQPISNLEELAAKAAVPKVEEWKKAAAEYKNSSITLGKFEFDNNNDTARVAESQRATDVRSLSYNMAPANEDNAMSKLWVTKASVDQFLLIGPRYWFLVRVEMNDGRHRNLCRYYEDFYDFQIALLEEFPVEAGRTGQSRILPFMPGPLAYVDDTITAQRRADLSVYVDELCHLPDHIVRSDLVQQLFAAREGDVESSHPTSMMPQPIFKNADRKRTSNLPNGQSQQALMSDARSSSSQKHPQGPRQSLTGHRREDQTVKHHSSNVAQAFIKIKVFFEDDLIAIRVAHDIRYEELCEKLRDRLDGKWRTISTKEDGAHAHRQIEDDAAFQDLLEQTDKVVLYVQ